MPYVPKEGEEIEKPSDQPRQGNIALDVERPLFQKGPNWEFIEFKNNLLANASNDEKLAELHFFDGKDANKKNYEHD